LNRAETYRNIGLLFGCEALTRTGAIIVLTTMGLAGRDMAPDPSLATLPLALVPATTMLTTIPAAHFMQRRGRKRGFALGAVLGVLGGLVCLAATFQHQFYLLCAGAVGIGAVNGFATYYRFAAAEIADEDFRSRAISLVMTGGIVAAVLGSSLATYFKDGIADIPFAGTFICMAAIQLLILMTVSFTSLPQPEAEAEKRVGRALSRIARQPRFVMAILGAVTSYGVMSLLMNATPLSMDRHSHSYADTTQVIMWHVLGMYVPSFFTGHLIRWFGEERIMMSGGGILLLSVFTSMGGTGMENYAWGLALLGVGWNFLFVGSTSLITGTYDASEKAKVQSTNDFLVFGAMVLATFSAGTLEQLIGWRAINEVVLGILALFLIIFAVLWVYSSRRLRKDTGWDDTSESSRLTAHTQ